MTKENLALFTEYLEYERLKGHTEQGFIDLRVRVPRFIEYLEAEEIPARSIRVKEAMGFQGRLIKKKLAHSTVASYIIPASAFCEYLRKKGIIPENPFAAIRRVRPEKHIPRNIPKETEMEKLLDLLARFDVEGELKACKIGYRLHVVCELLYSTGMRISEVAGIRVSDVDLGKGVVYVNCGKGGESRSAFLSDYARAVLRLYVTKIRKLIASEWNERNGELLFGVGWAWFGHIVNEKLRKAAKKLKMQGFTCHGFRHAVGYHLLRAGCNIRHIQEILGHKRLKTTEIYTKVDAGDLRSVLDRCHPRKWRGRA
jgi:site-specific recombinase XerD